jgi:hypothetical protein
MFGERVWSRRRASSPNLGAVRCSFGFSGPRRIVAVHMGKLTAMPPRLGAMPAKVGAAPKIAEAFYQSRAWRSLIAAIKRERGNWCERCGSSNRVIGDHVVERKDGGAELDPANVELLCQACHNVKTAAERAARATRGGGEKSGRLTAS